MSSRHVASHPAITLKFIAYGSRLPHKIFVPDPTLRGRWLLTNTCVALVPCSVCKALKGEPCKRHYGPGVHYHTSTHANRRAAVQWSGKQGLLVDDLFVSPKRRKHDR